MIGTKEQKGELVHIVKLMESSKVNNKYEDMPYLISKLKSIVKFIEIGVE